MEIDNGIIKLITKEEYIYDKVVPYEPDNLILDDGTYNKRGFDYTSGMIYSNRKFGYGKYEIKCKLPKGKGFWPAFWVFGGPDYNEIDVFEFWNEYNLGIYYDPSKLSKVAHLMRIINLQEMQIKLIVLLNIMEWIIHEIFTLSQ